MGLKESKVLLSNIVDREALRKVQVEVLEKISTTVGKTAGPFGSNTMVLHSDQLTEYTKDGHKTLKNIKFFKPLEAAIHDELLGITEHVLKTVGDGTTTAVQLSYLIYKGLLDNYNEWREDNYSDYQIIRTFESVTEEVCKLIKGNGRSLCIEDIYNICMISTNGNKRISEDIASIYEQYGKDVYIKLNTSNTENSIIKTYDGIILSKGYASPAYINTADNTVVIRNPRIYYFPDPVDTPEMISMFMNIFTTNIYEPYSTNRPGDMIPTVIICPTISRDAESALEDIDKIFYQYDTMKMKDSKPPFCIINGVNSSIDNIGDIVTLCDCPMIKKYINPDVQAEDIKNGVAPSKETVTDFYGSCDEIIISSDNASIINPKMMFNREDGKFEYSNIYNSLISFLQTQINQLSQDKNNIAELGNLKRRLHSLLTNFVEYYVGGISAADRDNDKDLLEDAILNCRSASIDGVGYGACTEGSIAVKQLLSTTYVDKLRDDILKIIYYAYYEIQENIYGCVAGKSTDDIIEKVLNEHKAYNVRTESFDEEPVLCSIETDIVILKAISKIITIMFTANQALLVDPMQNAYLEIN